MTRIEAGGWPSATGTMGFAALLLGTVLATGCCGGGGSSGGGGEALKGNGTTATGPDIKGIPPIPAGTSAPPTVSEWSAARDVNQANANSKPRDCEIKIVREWMKIHCDGNVKGVENVDGIGREGVDHFKQVTPGKVADFVVKLKKGGSIKMRILRDPQSATLFTNWVGGADRPGTVVMNIFAG